MNTKLKEIIWTGNYRNCFSIENDLLISERPQDYDWWFSKTLYEYGKLENTIFWDHIENIKSLILNNEFYLLDTLQWRNLLVKKISETIYIPIIIACKRLWWKSYPLQINLIFKKEKDKKINRIFQRLRDNFQK